MHKRQGINGRRGGAPRPALACFSPGRSEPRQSLAPGASLRHQPWLPSHRGRRTLCRRPERAADFLARLDGWLGPAIPSTPTCPRGLPRWRRSPSPDAKCRVCSAPLLLLRRCPSVRYCPQGPGAMEVFVLGESKKWNEHANFDFLGNVWGDLTRVFSFQSVFNRIV